MAADTTPPALTEDPYFCRECCHSGAAVIASEDVLTCTQCDGHELVHYAVRAREYAAEQDRYFAEWDAAAERARARRAEPSYEPGFMVRRQAGGGS